MKSNTTHTGNSNSETTRKQKPLRRIAKATAIGLATAGIIVAGAAMAGHGGKCHDKGGHGFKGMFHPSALEAVQATDAQKEQIRQLMQQARTERKANRDSRSTQHDNMQQQLREVFSQPTVTAEDLDMLNSSRKAQFEARKDSRQAHMAAMLNVLTPEQRVQLLELKKERRDKRRGERGERRTKHHDRYNSERGE